MPRLSVIWHWDAAVGVRCLRLFEQWLQLPRSEIACAVPDIACRWLRLLAWRFKLHGTNVFLRLDFVSCRRQIQFYRTNLVSWCDASVWFTGRTQFVSQIGHWLSWLMLLWFYLSCRVIWRNITSIISRVLPWTLFPVHPPIIILRCSCSLSQCF